MWSHITSSSGYLSRSHRQISSGEGKHKLVPCRITVALPPSESFSSEIAFMNRSGKKPSLPLQMMLMYTFCDDQCLSILSDPVLIMMTLNIADAVTWCLYQERSLLLSSSEFVHDVKFQVDRQIEGFPAFCIIHSTGLIKSSEVRQECSLKTAICCPEKACQEEFKL